MKYIWNACISVYMKKRDKNFVLLHFIFIHFTVFIYVHGNYLPWKVFKIWNILPSQGPSNPDLSSPVASAEPAPPTESLDGVQDVVADRNEGDEEEKIEVVMLGELHILSSCENSSFFFLWGSLLIHVYVHDWVLFISDSIREGEEKGWTTKKNSKISGIEIDNEHNNL